MADFARRKSPLPSKWRPVSLVLLLALLAVLVLQSGGLLHAEEAAQPAATSADGTANGEGTEQEKTISLEDLESAVNLFDLAELVDPFYEEVLDGWRAEGYTETKGVDITIDPTAYSAFGQTKDGIDLGLESRLEVVDELGGRKGPILKWLDEETWVEWEVDVPQSGFYNISLEFYPLDGKGVSALRDLQIDYPDEPVEGESYYPFNEARRLAFERTFVDAPVRKQDNQGNDIQPRQLEKRIWQVKPLQDQQGMYRRPFMFYMEKGKHTLRMNAIREPLAIRSIRVYSPEYPISYAEYKQMWDEKGATKYQGEPVKIQMEFAELKSSKTLRANFGFDPSDEPPSQGKYRLNEFGGWRWRNGDDWVTWKFSVPEDGFYKLGFKVANSWSRRLPSTRKIEIDGEIPFAELEEYLFDYGRDYRIDGLVNSEGEPYEIYLTKGEHELRMTAMVGPLAHTIRMLKDSVKELATLAMSITMITGPTPDPNMEYQIDEQVPGLMNHLEDLVNRFREEVKWVRSVTENNGLADQMEVTSYILESLWKNPDMIPRRLSEFAQQEQILGQRILDLQYAPLTTDYFYVASPDFEFPRVRASAWERFTLGVRNFAMSFTNDYTNVGNIYSAEENPDQPILKLWIGFGREWAAIIKEMIDEDFTPKTGIRVNVNVVPPGSIDPTHNSPLIMAVASGTAPDLVMGGNAQLPVEFAIRGGVVNLNQFPDYQDVVGRFRPGALVPYKYKGGDYAIPERQGFEMLFYRTDILKALGLEAPQTWDDVRAMLPVLQQYGMNFHYMGGYLPFLYQAGGTFYANGGMFSALDSPEALEAFKEWTELYTNYKIPMEANFYNRMRTGQSPIGIANYNVYIQLSTAAPELTGWWEMKPIPGHIDENGDLIRWSGGLTALGGDVGGGLSTVGVIFKDSKYKQESWQLLKWWTSEEIQSRFGDELEASIGMEARWNTANMDALRNLPWPRADIEAVLEQWQWLKEQPIVPGGYFTLRHYTFAWNQVVLEGANPREALEEAVKAIDRELRKKREEFGLEWYPRSEWARRQQEAENNSGTGDQVVSDSTPANP